MSIASKTAGVVLTATALCGMGAGTALAATSSTALAQQPSSPKAATGPQYPNAKTGDYIFFNASPWTEYVGTTNDIADKPFSVAPGGSVLIPHDQMVHYGQYGSLVPYADVSFVDSQGFVAQSLTNTTGNAAGVQSCTGPVAGTQSPEIGCIAQTPNVVAGEAGPTQISIWSTDNAQTAPLALDAKAPGADASAMGNFLSGIAQINSGWINFAPDQANPISWGHGPQTLAGAPYWNCGSGEAQEQIGGQAQHSETTSVTATVSVQQQVKLFDTVNTSITASISAGHAWTNATTDTHTESKNVDPGNVAWINSMPATETVTGTVTMTGNAAQPIHFANVSFSEPGRNQSGNPALDYAYIAHSRPMTTDETNLYCTGGPGPDGNSVHKVVVGGTLPDITAGATTTGAADSTANAAEPATALSTAPTTNTKSVTTTSH